VYIKELEMVEVGKVYSVPDGYNADGSSKPRKKVIVEEILPVTEKYVRVRYKDDNETTVAPIHVLKEIENETS
jgi:hypothetical protein